jgi:hypothetical protein
MTISKIAVFAVVAALFAIPARAEIPKATPEAAISMIATLFIYQSECLHGAPLDEATVKGLEIFTRASGLDMTSERAGAQIQLEIARQMPFVKTFPNVKKFCEYSKGLLQ